MLENRPSKMCFCWDSLWNAYKNKSCFENKDKNMNIKIKIIDTLCIGVGQTLGWEKT